MLQNIGPVLGAHQMAANTAPPTPARGVRKPCERTAPRTRLLRRKPAALAEKRGATSDHRQTNARCEDPLMARRGRVPRGIWGAGAQPPSAGQPSHLAGDTPNRVWTHAPRCTPRQSTMRPIKMSDLHTLSPMKRAENMEMLLPMFLLALLRKTSVSGFVCREPLPRIGAARRPGIRGMHPQSPAPTHRRT